MMQFLVLMHDPTLGWAAFFCKDREEANRTADTCKRESDNVKIMEARTVASWGPNDPGLERMPPLSNSEE